MQKGLRLSARAWGGQCLGLGERIEMRLMWFSVIPLVLVIGCSSSSPTEPTEPSLADLVQAPLEVELSGHTYVLETELILDRMPVVPQPPHGLLGFVTVSETEMAPVHSGLKIAKVWVVNEQAIWSTDQLEETPFPADHELQKYFRDGPAWVQIYVEVVVQLRLEGEAPLLLRATDQWISLAV